MEAAIKTRVVSGGPRMRSPSKDIPQDYHHLGGAGGYLRVRLGDLGAQVVTLHHTQTFL